MGCKFCMLGCPTIDKDVCCFECPQNQTCEYRCMGMAKEYKECDYYRITPKSEGDE